MDEQQGDAVSGASLGQSATESMRSDISSSNDSVGSDASTEGDATSLENSANSETNTSNQELETPSEDSLNTDSSDGEAQGDATDQKVPYDRFKEVNESNKALKEQLAQVQEQANLLNRLKQDPELARSFLKETGSMAEQNEADQVSQQAKEKLRELGFVSQDELGDIISQELRKQDIKRNVDSQIEDLSSKYDGSDGLPKFDIDEVSAYVDKTGNITLDEDGVPDLEKTFKTLHLEEFQEAKVKQAQRGTPSTETNTKISSSPSDAEHKAELKKLEETGDLMKTNLLDRFIPDKLK